MSEALAALQQFIANGGTLIVVLLVVGLALSIGLFVFWLLMLIHAIKHPDIERRSMWLVLLLLGLVIPGFSLIVPLVYYFKVKRAGAGATADLSEKTTTHSKLWTEYYTGAVLLLMVVFLIVSFGFLRPIIEDVKQANAETASVLEAVTNERAYLTSLENSINAAQSIPRNVLDKVTQALPSQPDTPSLLVQLDAAATRNEVRIQSVTFSQPKVPAAQAGAARPAEGQIQPVGITLSLTAKNYFAIKRFLADLESSLRVMDVVGIATSGISTESKEFNFTLEIKTYAFGGAPDKTPR